MNPGYAGRSELPDNLKAILRPVSMMVPDFTLIAEIMMFSEGFSSAKVLAKKMIAIMELSQQQLSKQDHYDYGLRWVTPPLSSPGGGGRVLVGVHGLLVLGRVNCCACDSALMLSNTDNNPYCRSGVHSLGCTNCTC
jgi:hypothetical protein